MSDDFAEMARKREIEAQRISDIDVWKSVVAKVLPLEVDNDVKADILLQSIPDLGVIFSQLKLHNKSGDLSDAEYHDILEVCIDKLEKDMKIVDFDPLKYDEDA